MPASRPAPVPADSSEAPFLTFVDEAIASSGSANHDFVSLLAGSGPVSRPTMADTLHHLSLLHGNRPSVFEVVAQSALVPAPEWLNAAMRAFAGERDLMSRLMVAAGPPPSRLGQTSVQETVSGTRSALLTLAGSDRLGCAIGAAAALLLDWDGVSEALSGIARRLGAETGPRHHAWPSPADTIEVAETAAALPGGERAVRFGFQTLLAQHRAFWNIVQSRATA